MLESFLAAVEQLPIWFKICIAASAILISWILEALNPAADLNYQSWWGHARVNLTLLLCTMVISAIFGASIVGVIAWGEQNQFGLLHLVDLPLWAELVIALMVLDFLAQYLVHILLHKVRWMWRLHIVHHSDMQVDATTGTRHHPGDFLFRELFALAGIVLFGIPLAFYALYRLITIPFTYFVHANIALPTNLNRIVNWVFVTPNMHRYHHHFELPWTDSNYGSVLSIWDRLGGTFTPADAGKVRFGINTLEGEPVEKLGFLLKVPFDPNLKRNSDMAKAELLAEG